MEVKRSAAAGSGAFHPPKPARPQAGRLAGTARRQATADHPAVGSGAFHPPKPARRGRLARRARREAKADERETTVARDYCFFSQNASAVAGGTSRMTPSSSSST